ncbi:hypothetical protein CSUNSWCD_368 [Campylobacter showae CSUNSWCD]|uniref:Uncharacterized protein n=1 Tax=Campylobacter showae CSUNSWCD TaxID=1244083 RepID=M5IT80_9BACT|nr:hypothetical protein CSUNSWCD_368 [Campylobacter showae CSUNSWCD]
MPTFCMDGVCRPLNFRKLVKFNPCARRISQAGTFSIKFTESNLPRKGSRAIFG